MIALSAQMRRLDREINLETEDWSKPQLPVWAEV
jgi:hypothetical protein